MHLATSSPDIQLVSWSPAHREPLVEQANDRAIWRNLLDTFPHPYTPADADFWVRHAAQASPSCLLAVMVEGQLAGAVGVDVGSGTEARTGHLGYWLGRRYWGRGIATQAVLAMTAHARASMPLARLQAPVFAWNPASMRVLEKAGFHREAVLRSSVYKDGQIVDAVLYALVLQPAEGAGLFR